MCVRVCVRVGVCVCVFVCFSLIKQDAHSFSAFTGLSKLTSILVLVHI